MRNDFHDMQVISLRELKKLSEADKRSQNFLVKDKNGFYLLLNEYKTSRKYGEKKIPIDWAEITARKQLEDIGINVILRGTIVDKRQNALAEATMGVIGTRMRKQLLATTLPVEYWEEACTHGNKLSNCCVRRRWRVQMVMVRARLSV